jgi:putative ABC transport system substrate-binding protein
MNHRGPIALLAAAILAFAALPLNAEQAPKSVTVGMFFSGNVPREQNAFLDQMHRLGYAEGVNVTYIRQRSTFDSAPAAAAELVAARPDIILTSANSNVCALKAATSTIPIVFAIAGDVELGLVASLAHPGGNLTGLSYQNGDLTSKRLQLLREAFPALRKIGVFHDPADGPEYRRAIEKISAGLGFELQAVDVPDGGAIDGAFAAVIAANAGAVFVTGGRVMTRTRKNSSRSQQDTGSRRCATRIR